MKKSNPLEAVSLKFGESRARIRPWLLLFLIAGSGAALLGLLALTLHGKSDRVSETIRQMVATHQIQHQATDLVLELDGVKPSLGGEGKPKDPLRRLTRLSEGLLDGAQVAALDIPPVRNPALRDSARALSASLETFQRDYRDAREMRNRGAEFEAPEKALHQSFGNLVSASRSLQHGLREEIRANNAVLRILQFSLMGFSALLCVALAVLLSSRARRRLGELLKIRQALQRYDMMFENSPLAYHSLDEDGKLLAVNQAWLDELGYEREEVLGTRLNDYLQPHVQDFFSRRFERFKSEGTVRGVNLSMRRRDGTAITTSFDGKIEKDEKGRFLRTHFVMKNITKQVAVENSLRMRERQQAMVAELGQDALACSDPQILFEKAAIGVAETLQVELSKVLEISPGGKSLLLRAGVGWKEGLVGKALIPVAPDSQAGYTLKSSGPVIVEDLSSEGRFRGPDLLIDHGVVSGMSVVIGSPDDPYGILAAHTRRFRRFSRDDIHFLQSVANLLAIAITRLRREARIRESENELRSLFEHAPVSISKQDMSGLFLFFDELRAAGVCDFRDHFRSRPTDLRKAAGLVKLIDVNQAYVEMYGARSKEELRISLARIFTSKALDQYVEELAALAEGRREFSQSTEFRSLTGETKEIFVSLLVDPVHPDGSLVYVSSVDMSALHRAERALGRSEDQLRTMLDAAEDIIFLKDRERRFTLVNPAQIRVIGLPANQIIGKTSGELFGDEFDDEIREAEGRVLAGEIVRSEHEDLIDGRLTSYSAVRVPVRNEAGEIEGLCGILRDVTDAAEATRSVAQREMLLRAIFESAQDSIFIKNLDSRYTLANPAMGGLFGLSVEELLHRSDEDLFGENTAKKLRKTDLKVFSGETVKSVDMNPVRGEARYFDVVKVPLHGPEGKIEGLVGIARDVTSYYEIKEEILKLATAIEQAGEVVVIADREGRIQYVNPAFEETTGWTRTEALGKTAAILKSGEHDEAFYRDLWDTILAGETWKGRFTNKRKDGSLFMETATISPVCDHDGRITHFVGVKHDVTRQMEMEEQIRHAQRMEAVGHLAGGLAHDFNNILQAMTGFLELARDGLDAEDQRDKDLREVAKGMDRATILTQELLTFSRVRKANLEVHDLRRIVRDSLDLMRPMLSEGIFVELKIPETPAQVMVDEVQMDRAIINLCMNARDAMQKGGELRIEIAAAHEGQISFSIADTGGGIPADRLGRIFDPFYSTKDVGEGTGLGLAVVHGIIKQHGGRIEVESEIGKGTRFRVFLPEAEVVKSSVEDLAHKALPE